MTENLPIAPRYVLVKPRPAPQSWAEAVGDKGLWVRMAEGIAEHEANMNGEVSADDLHRLMPSYPHDTRAFGTALANLVKRGKLRKGEYRASGRAECHGRPIRVFYPTKVNP